MADSKSSSKTKEDDLVFETFHHRSGKEFQCIYQSGMRFYLDDSGSKEWLPFPKRWYNEGLLVTNTILKDDGVVETNEARASGFNQGQGQARFQGSRQPGQGGSSSSDDREGFIIHPSRGRIPTYIFYKKHNVHMYFDKETGTWVRLPIAWELHHPMVKALVDQVEKAVPHWGDRHDILSLLRACNYDPDECISIYTHLERDEWMKVGRASKEAKPKESRENKVADLEKKVKSLNVKKTRPGISITDDFDNANPFTEGNAADEVEITFNEGKSLFVSKAFLSYSSPKFARMFQSGFFETESNTIDLTEKSYEAFLEMLLFLHPRVQKEISGENVMTIYKMAHEYQIPTVFKRLETSPSETYVQKTDKPKK